MCFKLKSGTNLDNRLVTLHNELQAFLNCHWPCLKCSIKGIECDQDPCSTNSTSHILGGVGGAQPPREAFVVVREEDGIGILEKAKETHTKNGGQTGVGVLNKRTHVARTCECL